MKRTVIRRDEMLSAVLNLGGAPIDLAEYATTGLLAVAVGPAGTARQTRACSWASNWPRKDGSAF